MTQFLSYDGEGIGNRYVLLANDRASIWNADGLSTADCLRFLTQRHRGLSSAKRVGFSLGYDINHWLRDVPEALRDALRAGKTVNWQEYTLTWIPTKLFRVQRKGTKPFTYYDAWGFFQSSFIRAMESYLGEVPEIILRGKAGRSDFSAWSEADVTAYNHAECVSLTAIMGKLDSMLQSLDPPIALQHWHGPGAVASWLLNHHNVWEEIRPFHHYLKGDDLFTSFRSAYFGGRIELFKQGTVQGPIYKYDINSAYPAMASWLHPITFNWEPRDEFDPSDEAAMSLWYVEWDVSDTGAYIGPFPYRDRNGYISFPLAGRGWYWWPEVDIARSLWGVARVRVLSGYVNYSQSYSVLNTVLPAMFDERARLKAAGDSRERVLKLGPNSLYGKFAQRRGDKVPRFYCLPWAGWITSATRAKLLQAVAGKERSIIGFATDGIFSTEPLPLALSKKLGEWDLETYDQGTFILPGVYRLDSVNRETVWHSRGYESIRAEWARILGELSATGKASIPIRIFVSHALADAMPREYGPHRLTFLDGSKTLNPASLSRKRVLTHYPPVFDWRNRYVDTGPLAVGFQTSDPAPDMQDSYPSPLPDWYPQPTEPLRLAMDDILDAMGDELEQDVLD